MTLRNGAVTVAFLSPGPHRPIRTLRKYQPEAIIGHDVASDVSLLISEALRHGVPPTELRLPFARLVCTHRVSVCTVKKKSKRAPVGKHLAMGRCGIPLPEHLRVPGVPATGAPCALRIPMRRPSATRGRLVEGNHLPRNRPEMAQFGRIVPSAGCQYRWLCTDQWGGVRPRIRSTRAHPGTYDLLPMPKGTCSGVDASWSRFWPLDHVRLRADVRPGLYTKARIQLKAVIMCMVPWPNAMIGHRFLLAVVGHQTQQRVQQSDFYRTLIGPSATGHS